MIIARNSNDQIVAKMDSFFINCKSILWFNNRLWMMTTIKMCHIMLNIGKLVGISINNNNVPYCLPLSFSTYCLDLLFGWLFEDLFRLHCSYKFFLTHKCNVVEACKFQRLIFALLFLQESGFAPATRAKVDQTKLVRYVD